LLISSSPPHTKPTGASAHTQTQGEISKQIHREGKERQKGKRRCRKLRKRGRERGKEK
jgi:hypothetical protein